ncbi:MAG: acyl-CoA dehydrogenase [Betaproteobacteria bacterium]|nr:acyl-CoA dehydrogenase [Betaproteobacteria bacterium]
MTALWLAGFVVAIVALAYAAAPAWLWAAAIGAFLLGISAAAGAPGSVTTVLLIAFAASAAVLTFAPLRRALISDRLLAAFRRVMPPMSQTESDAINAGTVWWDAELFSGNPDWGKLLGLPASTLTSEEQSFLDNETAELCAMSNDWQQTHHNYDMPPEVWQYIKDKGFLGMIIPKRYGGKEFSAYMHSQVVMKLSTRCSATAVSVMVPNSLGPAELLLNYGTEEQKNHYLPRLARGQEIPCFALTNPHAGSDAAAIPDFGIVCKGMWNGKEVLGMRVTWEKRYITLGPVATLLGLAFQLRDPDRLLGGEEDVGITCALVPTDTPGVHIGRRHMPLNAVFQNGPNWGKDVFMPLDWIIGGREMAGQGWRMLMESLAAGRSISLPSSNVGMSKLAVRGTGAYARVRSQFRTPIGKFEGIEEALTRMGGNLYMADAARVMTAGAIDLGERPSVISAIVKYHVTERNRQIVNDAMDVLGGKGICLGPNNFMGRAYQQVPVSITVEGANILTRSLIVFGQGAIRCHPYVLKEMSAARDGDPERAGRAFDQALWSHVGFTFTNAARAFVMGITGSHWVKIPAHVAPETRRYYQQLTRFSAAFAFIGDVSMLALGGGLKRREKLSARLGDILSLMYLASAVLKRFEGEGRQAADAPLLHWAIWDCMYRAQNALEGVISNYPSRAVSWVLRRIIFPIGRPYVVPSDKLGHEVARLLIEPSATRDRLTAGMYLPSDQNDPFAILERALDATIAAESIEKRIRAAQKEGRVSGATAEALADAARAAGIIEEAERESLRTAAALRDEVIRVDDFPPDFGLSEFLAKPATARRVAA